MGYDLRINDKSFNYTYNVRDMWYACYPQLGIKTHCGLTGLEALPVLRKLRDYMEENCEELEKLNPENGWGDFQGALNFVNRMIIASIQNSTYIWDGD